MTVQDDNGPGTQFGADRDLVGIGNGLGSVAPTSATYPGKDPAAPAPGPGAEQPGMEVPDDVEAPEPISAENIALDLGNSGLSESDLTNLFTGF